MMINFLINWYWPTIVEFAFSLKGAVFFAGLVYLFWGDDRLKIACLIVATVAAPIAVRKLTDKSIQIAQIAKVEAIATSEQAIEGFYDASEKARKTFDEKKENVSEALKEEAEKGKKALESLEGASKKALVSLVDTKEKLLKKQRKKTLKKKVFTLKSVQSCAPFAASFAGIVVGYQLAKWLALSMKYRLSFSGIGGAIFFIYYKHILTAGCICIIYYLLREANKYRLKGDGGKGGDFGFDDEQSLDEQQADLIGRAPAQIERQAIEHDNQINLIDLSPAFETPKVDSIEESRYISDGNILYLLASQLEIPPNIRPRFVIAVQTLEKKIAQGDLSQRHLNVFLEQKGNLLLPGESPVWGLDGSQELLRFMRANDRQERIRKRQLKNLEERRAQVERERAHRHEQAALNERLDQLELDQQERQERAKRKREEQKQEKARQRNERQEEIEARQAANLENEQAALNERLDQLELDEQERQERAERKREEQKQEKARQRNERQEEIEARQAANLENEQAALNERLDQLELDQQERQERAERKREEQKQRRAENIRQKLDYGEELRSAREKARQKKIKASK